MISRERDRKIIALVASGHTNREVGEVMGLTECTVKNYLRPIYEELGVSNRVELTLWHVAHKQQTGD